MSSAHCLVVVGRVDDRPMTLTSALVELRLQLGHVAELGGADRGEVLGVREEDRPRIADPVVEADAALGGLGLEVRCGVADRNVIVVSWSVGRFRGRRQGACVPRAFPGYVCCVPSYQIMLLGRFAVRVDGQPVPAGAWRHKRAAELVKVLALAETRTACTANRSWICSGPVLTRTRLRATCARPSISPALAWAPQPLSAAAVRCWNCVPGETCTWTQ